MYSLYVLVVGSSTSCTRYKVGISCMYQLYLLVVGPVVCTQFYVLVVGTNCLY